MVGFERIKGFTLIELIVVIALISIMLFLAIPKFQSDIFTDSTKKVSRWIIYKVPALKKMRSGSKKDMFCTSGSIQKIVDNP